MTDDPDAPPSARRQRRWWPLIASAAMVLTVVLCFTTSWDSVWNSHPAYWISLLVAAAGAVALGIWAWTASARPRGSNARRITLRILLVIATLVPATVLIWLRPLGPDSVALRALEDSDGVSVRATSLVVRMDPDDPKSTGLVFYPGAKVDPRAYAHILRPIAEAGYPVVIIKLPFNLAVLSPNAADAVVGDDDDVDRWVVGGHSLGGAMAATYASKEHDELVGLLLYAAYPASDMSSRTGLDITSIYGTEDGLATVADIEDSKANLPPDTRFVPIDGGIHAYFGDYGAQSGDGTSTITRSDAQAQIVEATLAQMERVDRAA
jgi:hypothetical protein